MSFAHRAIDSAEEKIAEAPGHPLVLNQKHRLHRDIHGSNLKAHFLRPNMMSG